MPHPIHTELKYERKNRSRDYTFNFSPGKKRLTGLRVNTQKGKTTEKPIDTAAPAQTQDGLSWIYYMRTQNLEEGKTLTYHAHSGNYLYIIDSTVVGIEQVWTRLGLMESYKLETQVFRASRDHKIKDALLWFGTGINHLPIKAQFDLRVGRVEALLHKIEQPTDSAGCNGSRKK